MKYDFIPLPREAIAKSINSELEEEAIKYIQEKIIPSLHILHDGYKEIECVLDSEDIRNKVAQILTSRKYDIRIPRITEYSYCSEKGPKTLYIRKPKFKFLRFFPLVSLISCMLLISDLLLCSSMMVCNPFLVILQTISFTYFFIISICSVGVE